MNRLPELRAAKGITMKDAAKALGMPYTTYVNYEKAAREPNSEVLIQLANFYGVTVDYLLGRDTPPETVSDEEIKFALFNGAPVTDAQFEEVKRFAKYIADQGLAGK